MSKPNAMRKAIGRRCLSVRYANIHPIIDETKLFLLAFYQSDPVVGKDATVSQPDTLSTFMGLTILWEL